MKRDRICANLEGRELKVITDAMEFFTFKANETVVSQGSDAAYFFVVDSGRLDVVQDSKVVNTLKKGDTLGGLSLLYNCPRIATVVARDAASLWGVQGDAFREVLQESVQHHTAQNRMHMDSLSFFDGLSPKQKSVLSECLFTEVYEANERVVTEGEQALAIYFVNKGHLRIIKGASQMPSGEITGGTEVGTVGPGESFGERAVLYGEARAATVEAIERCELLSLGIDSLKSVLGNEVGQRLQQLFVLHALRQSAVMSQFSSIQQQALARVVEFRKCPPHQAIQPDLRFAVVVTGHIVSSEGGTTKRLERGQWFEDASLISSPTSAWDDFGVIGDLLRMATTTTSVTSSPSLAADTAYHAGHDGAKLAVLTCSGLLKALKELGMSAMGTVDDALNYTRKMVIIKKVAAFHYLAEEQIDALAHSFVVQRYKKGASVIREGEVGKTFFVVAEGEVNVYVAGTLVRSIGKNGYFGERALLFDQPRAATVVVVSASAELWSMERAHFSKIVKGKMRENLMHLIRLQSTCVTLDDLDTVSLIGVGGMGVVRCVVHRDTGMRYALKRVKKVKGKEPTHLIAECALLAANDHPFVLHLVKQFETTHNMYMLTELITGGELHAALRTMSQLPREHAQFYTGSLVLVLESLHDRNIIYRDLKPENIMLDTHGYVKLVDFGIGKKLEEGKTKTFTIAGTPHYMAPEVMKSVGYATEVDLWSLGVLLFELVCGFLPFGENTDSTERVLEAVLRAALTFPSQYTDQDGRSVIKAMLNRNPKKRLGAGLNGYEDLKAASFWKIEGGNLFQKITSRELEAPVVPDGEHFADPEDLGDTVISDLELD
eukprot:CAMPEP_0194530218 /NCGR_PEP_ID=MMETSP0253-20130528/67095_1 /TAXON_ID=2966 /ORGANISM="Noctiluca scintillans" /LENGTH=831 /DNA_ID=CAMNT_0039375417 /DNA_START=29 /DNA_END=2524 /DNA_ORIENTATION=-